MMEAHKDTKIYTRTPARRSTRYNISRRGQLTLNYSAPHSRVNRKSRFRTQSNGIDILVEYERKRHGDVEDIESLCAYIIRQNLECVCHHHFKGVILKVLYAQSACKTLTGRESQAEKKHQISTCRAQHQSWLICARSLVRRVIQG